MSRQLLLSQTMKTGRRLLADRAGNVTITFALAFLPLVALVGAAIDYSRASAIRTSMQSAADMTSLAVAKSAATLTADEIQSQSETIFKASFTRKDATDLAITTSYTTTGGTTLTVGATAKMKTNFLGVMGITEMVLGTSSTSAWGQSRLRVALVLDNTGSMSSSGKLTALKKATKTLLAQLKAAATAADDVYVSIIPFVKDVAADKASYSENWIYWGTSTQDPTLSDDSSWDANNGSCSGASGSTRSACYANACSAGGYTNKTECTANYTCTNPLQTTQSACTGQKACTKSYSSQNSCEYHYGTWGYGTWNKNTWSSSIVWTPSSHSNWNGCITDRGDNAGPNTGAYDTITTSPSSSIVATLFPAEQYAYCPAAVLPLNNNWTTMTTFVDNMVANGSTNQGIGFIHGWQSLVGGGPYPNPPTMDTANYKYKQVIILLTDGLNTQNRWWGNGSSTGTSDDAKIDARQQLACSNAKGAGITVYTVQVNTSTPKDATSAVLQNCASANTTSDPGEKFFLLTSSDAMVSTFQQIGTQISKLRIAK
jgi:Flp pilus assembly protein TadG